MSELAQAPEIGVKTPQKRGRGNPAWGSKADGTGKSGNLAGHPHGLAEFRELCRSYTTQAVQALVFSLGDPAFAVAAARVLLEHGWGKPPQEVRVGAGEMSVSITVTPELLEANISRIDSAVAVLQAAPDEEGE